MAEKRGVTKITPELESHTDSKTRKPVKALLSSCQPAVRYDGYSCLNREPQGVACGFRLRGAPARGAGRYR